MSKAIETTARRPILVSFERNAFLAAIGLKVYDIFVPFSKLAQRSLFLLKTNKNSGVL